MMINNDESYMRIDSSELDDFLEYRKFRRDWRIRAVRPIFQEEYDAGLVDRQEYGYQLVWDHPEYHPELTHALDAFYKLRQSLEFWAKLDTTLEDALVHYLATNFYDCMSGGCSPYALALIRKLLLHLDTDRTKDVYPKKEGDDGEWTYSTVQDFLDEMDSRGPGDKLDREALPDLSMLTLEPPDE